MKGRNTSAERHGISKSPKELEKPGGHSSADLTPHAQQGAVQAKTLPGGTCGRGAQGFDHRLSRRNLYGDGVYVTTDFCKDVQYCINASSDRNDRFKIYLS